MFSYEVPRNQRLLQCACAIIWCLLSGGPIFGFAALKPVLITEHVYEYMCDISINGTSSASSSLWAMEAPTSLTNALLTKVFTTSEPKDIVAKCTQQDLKLNMMFTVGAVLTNVSALAIGRVLDVYGPRVCGLVGAFFLFLASFVFIYADFLVENTPIDPYLTGYASMALGGPFAYISSFQLSNSFPKNSGTILALVTGAFDASSAVFLFYKIFYVKTNGAFSLGNFFKLYSLVPVFITVVEFLIMPAESYQTPADNNLCVDDEIEHHVSPINSDHSHTESTPLLDDTLSPPPINKRRDSIGDALKQPYAEEGEEFLVEHTGGVFGILHGYSAQYQIQTPWFVLTCLFATIQMLRINYFVATIGTQYAYLFGSVTEAEHLNKIFDIALPLGGIVSVPFIGIFLDNCSTVLVLSVLLSISLVIGFLGLVSNFFLGVVGVLMFVAYRPLFYTTVSDFCAKVFGFETFGTVYGAIICISGIFNFGQSILDKWTHTSFNMNPIPINVILIAVTAAIGVANILYVKTQAQAFIEKKRIAARASVTP
ncbi:uncharacterized protein RJT20DRAFT_134389 [Scheffersomyces xylosifermentans]|uniref:uncharacterized protein n=1 Tax=Scheffersomyces xylosifermentans TaxID=1304137 RepID=UPI00315C8919